VTVKIQEFMRKDLDVFLCCYIKQQMATNLTSKNIENFYCEICDFICCKKGDYTRHKLTRKHILATDSNTNYIKKTSHICENCNKEYKDRTGLWRHKKKCVEIQHVNSENEHIINIIDKEMLIKLLLKNQDVMEKMMEIMPQIGNQSHNNHNTNSNNNFNIQMFLNNHCKNAMNLTDFIESLPITADTYDSTIENGLTKTLTNMITNGLSQLDILERPIHCTDATRKTLYVKEDNNWEKDTELIRMLLGIKTIARKQRMMINKWQDANEGWEKEDYIQTKLTTLISHSMTNIESDEKETSKIVRAISKNVYLDNETKQQYLK
jgi:hypothetical protein